MIVEELASAPADGDRVRLSSRIRGGGLDEIVSITVPGAWAAPRDDASWALALALPLAGRARENLEVAGSVDAQLLARSAEIAGLYHAFDPSMGLTRVTARATAAPRERAAAAAVCISRGVDSTYTAALGATAGGPLTHGVFADGLEPAHGPATRGEEMTRAAGTATALGLEPVVVEAHLRHLTEQRFDWEDACAAGLSAIAHALSGGLGRLVIPSSDSAHSAGACGTSPLLDPLFSGSAVAIEHGPVLHTRHGKLEWLLRERPQLLAHVKVCYAQDTAGNCGRCGKCLHTLACLRVLGALDRVRDFPPDADLELLAQAAPAAVQVRLEYAELAALARERGDHELAHALESSLSRTREPRAAVPGRESRFRSQHDTLVARVLAAPHAGLVRAVDLRARRHVYAAGRLPGGTVTAELGALMREALPGTAPVWIDREGRVSTPALRPPSRAGTLARLRFLTAPLLVRRPLAALRRAADLRTRACAPESAGPPAGHLFAAPAPGRIALWAAGHPVTGDQLLSTDPAEAGRAGYGPPALIGHLAEHAPVTGRLGVHATPLVPWAGSGGVAIGSAS